MIKRILILCILVLLAAYLVVAVTALNAKPQEKVCEGVELTVKDTTNYGFVTMPEIKAILQHRHLYPQGKKIKDINVRQLEETLSQHPFIHAAECYLSSGNKVIIHIYQRVPVLHILSDNGDDYYIDHNGKIMNIPGRSVRVTVATGAIDRKYACKELYALGKFIYSDKFWSAQVEQINITPQQEIELVPRIGSQILFLGKAEEDYNEKFNKLQAFYKEALNRVGWNKYDRISIEFNNQIICTKKEK